MMSSVGNILLDKEILLESGTNELEVLVFNVADYCFGINVAKVREVLPAPRVTALPKAHPSVRGLFRLRDVVIPCVSLFDHLHIPSADDQSERTLILTDFNMQQTAFFVDQVERIHRISWEQVMPMPPLGALARTPVTGVIQCDGRLIVMLDFEMIIDKVTNQAFRTESVDNPHNLPRDQMRIVVADDSPTIRETMGKTLRASGYIQLEVFENGAQAWNWLESQVREVDATESVVDLIISDVEMPQMDGLHLTKRIKQHPQLQNIPVMLYSSIVTPDNKKKGEAVGADMQVSKPELNNVVRYADQLISRARGVDHQALASPTETPPADSAKPPKTIVTSDPPPKVRSAADSPRPADSPTGDAVSQFGPVWLTFRTELASRADEIRRHLSEAANDTAADQPMIHGMFRTLHSIKSASMVIAIDPITQLTHQIETLLESIRDGHFRWTPAPFEQFADWLDDLAESQADLAKHWRSASALQSEFQNLVATPAAVS